MTITVRPAIVQRLSGLLAPLPVSGVSNLQGLLQQSIAAPGVYVWRSAIDPETERGDTEDLSGVFQDVWVGYSVLSVTKLEKGAVEDDAQGLSDSIQGYLIGWDPLSNNNPLFYGGGRGLIDLEQNRHMWQDVYWHKQRRGNILR